MEGAWPRDEAGSWGQVFEDRVCALLTKQSRGQLPGSTGQTRLDKYRRALSNLCAEVEGLL